MWMGPKIHPMMLGSNTLLDPVVTQGNFIILVPVGMEKEDLGMRPNCHLLGFGDDDTSSILCHFRKWPITSLPWNWVREQQSKEAFVSVERAVSAGSTPLHRWRFGLSQTASRWVFLLVWAEPA